MLIYDVAFTAETEGLKKQLDILRTEVKDIMDFKGVGVNANFDPIKTKGRAAAQFLQNALEKATSINGTSLTRFNEELRKAGVSAEQLAQYLSAAGMHQNLQTLSSTIASADSNLTVLNARLKEMHRVLSQSVKFRMAMAVQDFLLGQAQAAVQWTKDMNQGMIDIQIVSEKTGAQMEAVFDRVIKKSKELETTAREYSQAALIYYQQGLDDDEVTRRTDITIKAARAAGEDAEQMSKNLTAIWNTYQMQGDRLQNAASIAARLGADTAVDFAYIAEAMQTSATAAAQMGLSYENLAAIIATVGETTMQASSVVGNAFKTIISRFDQLKSSGTDGEVELGRISQQLADMGIHILDVSGELKSMDTIIYETGDAWDNYSQKQQIAIAEVLGGTRQFGQVLALFNNWDKFLTNAQTAFSETGDTTLEDQFAVASESIQVTADMAAEAWQRAFGQLANEDALSGFYGALKAIGEQVEFIIGAFGGLPGLLVLIGAALSKNIVSGLSRAGTMIIENNKNMQYAARNNITISQASRQRPLEEMRNALPENSSQRRTVERQMDPRAIANFERLNEVIRTGNELQKAAAQAEKDRFLQLQANITETDQKLEIFNQKLRDSLTANSAMADGSKNKMSPETENLTRLTAQMTLEISPAEKQRLITELQTSLVGYPIELNIQKDESFAAYIQRLSQELKTFKAESGDLMTSANASLEDSKYKFTQASTEVTKLQKEISGLEAALDKLLGDPPSEEGSAAIEEMDLKVQKLQEKLSDAIEILEGAEQGMRKMEKAAKDAAKAEESISNVSDDIITNLGEAGNQLNSFNNDVANVERTLSDFNTMERPQMDWSQVLSGFTTMSMGIVSLINTFSMLSESELTIQSVGQALLTMLISLPMIVNGFSSFTGAIIANSQAMVTYNALSALAAAQDAAQIPRETLIIALKAANKEVTEDMTDAQLVEMANNLKASGTDLVRIATQGGLGAAIKATTVALLAQAKAFLTSPIGAAIVALTAIIIAFVAVWKSIEKQSPEYKLAQAKEEAERLGQVLNDAKARANELRESFNRYDTAVKALSECQKGTEEWRDALKAVNDEALDILTKYPDLAKMDGLFTRDSETGMLTMNADVKDQALSQVTSSEQGAQFAALIAEVRVSQAQSEVSKNNLINELSSATGGYYYASSNIVNAAADLANLTDEEYSAAVRDLLGDTSQLSDTYQENIVNASLEYKDSIQALADQTDSTVKQMELATQLLVDNMLGDSYSAEAKVLAAQGLDNVQQEIFTSVEETIRGWARTGVNKGNSDLDELWARYTEAIGMNLELDKNSLRGNAANRTMAYLDPTNAGEVKEVTAREVATQIAAYEALQQLTDSAEEAAATLRGLDARVGTGEATSTGVDSIRRAISGEGLGGYTQKELNQLKAEIEEAGGAVEYLQNQTGLTLDQIADTFGPSFVENFTRSLETNWDQIKLPDLPGLDELAYDAAAKMDNIFQGDFFQDAVAGAFGDMDTEQLVVQAAAVADVFKQAMTDKLAEVPEAARASMLSEISEMLQQMPPEMRTLDLVTRLTEVDNLEEFREYVEGQLEFAARFAPREDASDSSYTEKEAEDLDYSTEAFKEYAKQLRETALAHKDVNKDAKVTQASINETAEGALKAAVGVNKLAEAFEDYEDELKPSNKGTASYIKAMGELRKAMGQVLDIAPEALSTEFMDENLELMQEAAKGSASALEELRIAAGEDIFATVMLNLDPNLTPEGLSLKFSELQGLLDGLDLQAGMVMDTGPALKALSDFIVSTGMTVDQANTLFEGMGYDVELKPVESVTESVSQLPQTRAIDLGTQPVPGRILNADNSTTDITAYVPQWGYEVKNIDIPASEVATATGMEVTADGSGGGSAKVGEVLSVSKKATGSQVQSARPAVTGGGSTKPKGGGGSGSKPKEKGKAPEKSDPVIVRYENIENTVADLTRSIDRLSEAEEHLFGRARLTSMQKKQRELLNLAAAQAKYASEARKYYQIDRADFLENLEDGVAQFDAHGYLTNIEQVRQYWQNEQDQAYQELMGIYNSLPETINEAQEAQLKAAEERYNARKEFIDLEIEKLGQLLETEEKVKEQIDAATETFRAMMQLKLDEASYKLDLRITISDMEVQFLDYMAKRIDRMGVSANKTSQFFENLNGNIAELIKQSKAYTENIDRMYEIMNNVEDSSPHKPWFIDQLSNMGYSKDSANEIWDNFQETGRMDAEIMDILREDAESLLDINEALFEAMYSAWDHYIETFEGFMDKFDQIVGRFDGMTERINNINGLLSIFGMTATRNSQQVANLGVAFDLNGRKMVAYQAKAQEAAAWAADAKNHLDYALSSGNQDLIEEAQRTYDEVQQTADEAYDEYLASMREFADSYVEIWGQMVDLIVADFSAKIFPLATSMDAALESLDLQREVGNFWLDAYQSGYQYDRLLKKISEDTEHITDPKQRELYDQIQAEILAKQEAGALVTEKDVELWEKRLNVAKEQAAFEDSQRAKNTMRLARDASGNWNYVYSEDSANSEDTGDKKAEAEYDYYTAVKQAIDDYSAKLRETEAASLAYYQERMKQRALINAEDSEALAKFDAETEAQMNRYSNLILWYAGKIDEYAGFIGLSHEDMALTITSGYNSAMEEALAYLNGVRDTLVPELNAAETQMRDDAASYLGQIGVSFETLGKVAQTEIDKIKKEADSLSTKIKDTQRQSQAALQQMSADMAKLSREWVENISKMIAANEALYKSIQTTFEQKANLDGDGDISYDPNRDYMADIMIQVEQMRKQLGVNEYTTADALQKLMSDPKFQELIRIRNAKIEGEGLDYGMTEDILAIIMQGNIGWEEGQGWVRYVPGKGRVPVSYQDMEKYFSNGGRFNTGGLVPGGDPSKGDIVPAMLTPAEYVLNPKDTQAFFKAFNSFLELPNFQGDIGEMLRGIGGLEQAIQIYADFPNVSSRDEIQAAFNNLLNQAKQYRI